MLGNLREMCGWKLGVIDWEFDLFVFCWIDGSVLFTGSELPRVF